MSIQRMVVTLELINATVGIVTNIVAVQNQNQVFGLPVGYVNSIFFALVFIGFLVLYLTNNKLKQEIKLELKDNIIAELKLEFGSITKVYPNGSLDSVSAGDKLLITANAMEMTFTHGHMDFEGLLADRASHVPLNELMSMPCSKCGVPSVVSLT